MTLLVAGHETTASALTWAFYWIHHLPEVHDKLMADLGTLGDGVDPMEMARLRYLSAVCSETLRIYPIAPSTFIRILKSPMEIGGYQFEADTALMPSIYLIHQREEIYPEPKRFKPERFLERHYSPENAFNDIHLISLLKSRWQEMAFLLVCIESRVLHLSSR